jgi:glycopeptide antibiotics resistance protein
MRPYHFFTTKDSMRTIDTYRILFAGLAVLSFFLTEAGRFVYRPYIYSNGIDDFGIADSMGNLGGIMVQIFLMLAVLNPPRKIAHHTFLFLVGGYILYEFMQLILPKGTFDWMDVYGTLVGGVIAYGVYHLVRLLIRKNKVLLVIK